VTLHQTPGPAMTDVRTELATLVASRLCHDLISPIGAISNGLEMLEMAGGLGAAGPELQLIAESCDNASARVRFFRLAYGAASETAMVSAAETRGICSALTAGSRLRIDWDGSGDCPRRDVQLAFLAVQCLETALRRGGSITIRPEPGKVAVSAEADSVHCDPALWRHLDGSAAPTGVLGSASGLSAAQVQYVLLPVMAADLGRRINARTGERFASITV